MRIEDLLLFLPRRITTALLKINRFELDDRIKDEIISQGLYHFTPSEEVADQIIKAEYLKPSNLRLSYGIPCAFMFCGVPDVDNYSKNVSMYKPSLNPYANPTMVAHAIKFTPQRDELKNYKVRALVDNAIIYEGYCLLPHNQVQKVRMVPDLQRDSDGKPILNEEGNYSVIFREANDNEILPDGRSYRAKPDYLDYMREIAQKIGYNQDNTLLGKLKNKVINILNRPRVDYETEQAQIRMNKANGFEFKKRKNKVLPQTIDEALQSFSFKRKNPYNDKKYAMFVAQEQTADSTQLDLNEVLPEFTNSKTGEFFFRKYEALSGVINKGGIHGKQHSDRVALMAMMIAEIEGVFEHDDNNRIRDILATAAMYHDLGRVFDIGPHAKNSVRKLREMRLCHLDGRKYTDDDKNLLFALVDAHEGTPDKINEMIPLYQITNPSDQDLALKLSSIVRDADALDRVRTDINLGFYKTDLKPKYLVNRTSKQFLNLSYQLEHVTKHIKDMRKILGYQTDYEETNREARGTSLDKYIVPPGNMPMPMPSKIKETKVINKDDDIQPSQ